MILWPSRARGPFLLAAFFVLSPALAVPAQAIEVGVFLSEARPSVWGTGLGGTLTTTWFKLVCLEAELARQPGVPVDSSMTSFTASALLAPPIGPFTPFGGLGVGLFRQSRGALRDNGTLNAFVLGVKLKVAGVLVIRAEYRAIDLSGEAPLAMDQRFSGGIGISF
jgi:opacity protein-like surface antigen